MAAVRGGEQGQGRVVGSRYTMGDEIGRGASGVVHKALNFQTGGAVAIKEVPTTALATTALAVALPTVTIATATLTAATLDSTFLTTSTTVAATLATTTIATAALAAVLAARWR
jgi:hypothetical protein